MNRSFWYHETLRITDTSTFQILHYYRNYFWITIWEIFPYIIRYFVHVSMHTRWFQFCWSWDLYFIWFKWPFSVGFYYIVHCYREMSLPHKCYPFIFKAHHLLCVYSYIFLLNTFSVNIIIVHKENSKIECKVILVLQTINSIK